ncbi:MAG TPA: tRNA (5-methylaminomethyl-2-thiouridine)(34)-methyltransferase MnmD [Phnomibacter sp.]|nr:tRNA (5-methylaminomethyl-2-thiouridine)(34)-methyltransferase MnmD [Phnomibacter sp.]
MKRELCTTTDGSHTIAVPEMDVLYHSKHGAVQESEHVFIQAGLEYILPGKTRVDILEMGLGTGLNALLTWKQAENLKVHISYHSIEAYPLEWPMVQQLNYPELIAGAKAPVQRVMETIHQIPDGQMADISTYFSFTPYHTTLQHFNTREHFHCIYFDAFAPEAQPELWTTEIFEKLYGMMAPGGCLVTYCSKGSVRRAMVAAGWTVTKLPGPPGKREMVRALYLPPL